MPAHSTKPLTLPDDIEFRTSKRAKIHGDGEVSVATACLPPTCP